MARFRLAKYQMLIHEYGNLGRKKRRDVNVVFHYCDAQVDRFGGGMVMVWKAISYRGKTELVLVFMNYHGSCVNTVM